MCCMCMMLVLPCSSDGGSCVQVHKCVVLCMIARANACAAVVGRFYPSFIDAHFSLAHPPFSLPPSPCPAAISWNHHSASDTIDRMDARQLNHHAAALAVWAYAVAQLPELLPRNESAPPAPPPTPSDKAASAGAVAASVAGVAVIAAAGVMAWRNRDALRNCRAARSSRGGASTPGGGIGAAYRSMPLATDSA